MSVGKLAIVTIGLICACLLLPGCEGDTGPQGPPGLPGVGGPPGADRSVPVPSDRVFGLRISNGTAADYRWVADIQLTFDETQTPSASQVVGSLLDNAPTIDGVDNGAAEWGNAAVSNIPLSQIAGEDNGITSASVRFGYDLDYIYMQVSWTEVATGNFVVAADRTKDEWVREGTNWNRVGGEDVAWIGWDGAGSSSLTGKLATARTSAGAQQTGTVWDVWAYHSTITGYSPYLRDMAVWSDDANTIYLDAGFDFVADNIDNSNPWRMRKNSSALGSAYPLRAFEATAYNAVLGWIAGATIPGYVFFEPSGSLIDVDAIAQFADGTWTLELRRLRNTGNGDDAAF